MKQKLFILCLAAMMISFIGPGPSDFSAKLVGDYSIYRTSGHQIMISPDVWSDGTPLIPTKVIECAVDRHLILAKRQGMKRRSPNNPNNPNNPNDPNDPMEEPDPKVFDYWILDTSVPKVFGPMNLDQFKIKRLEFSVPEKITLKDVYDYRPKT